MCIVVVEGPPGGPGVKGMIGDMGMRGLDGPNGDTGRSGPPGRKGDSGDEGAYYTKSFDGVSVRIAVQKICTCAKIANGKSRTCAKFDVQIFCKIPQNCTVDLYCGHFGTS